MRCDKRHHWLLVCLKRLCLHLVAAEAASLSRRAASRSAIRLKTCSDDIICAKDFLREDVTKANGKFCFRCKRLVGGGAKLPDKSLN